MTRSSLVFMMLVLGIGKVSAAEMDKARLRQLASLPKFRGELMVTISRSRGLRFNEPSRPATEEIARLKKLLNSGGPDSYLRLGDFLSRQGDREEADRIYAKAVALCRKRVREHPENMRFLAQLGDALLRTEQSKEGQTSARLHSCARNCRS
jgi:tetratricopeptide (TPR) repeat protein